VPVEIWHASRFLQIVRINLTPEDFTTVSQIVSHQPVIRAEQGFTPVDKKDFVCRFNSYDTSVVNLFIKWLYAGFVSILDLCGTTDRGLDVNRGLLFRQLNYKIPMFVIVGVSRFISGLRLLKIAD
jgi:hypothetical protein